MKLLFYLQNSLNDGFLDFWISWILKISVILISLKRHGSKKLLQDTFTKLDPTTLQDVDPSDTRRNMKAHADPPLRLGQQLDSADIWTSTCKIELCIDCANNDQVKYSCFRSTFLFIWITGSGFYEMSANIAFVCESRGLSKKYILKIRFAWRDYYIQANSTIC